jgi:beta-glucanase (GH16 family)
MTGTSASSASSYPVVEGQGLSRAGRIAVRSKGRVMAFGVAGILALALSGCQPPPPSTSPCRHGDLPRVGDLPGWRLALCDDFNGTSLDRSKWGAYHGQPRGDPGGWWDPSHVVVHNGLLELRSYRDSRFGNRWVSGGMSSARGLKQRYGLYLVRFRVDKGHGIAAILLLWPSTGGWPPEVDFAEDGGGDRSRTTATLHYGQDNRLIQRSVTADFSKWHTIGVAWLPGRLIYLLDNRVWATVTSANVPNIPMEMDAQTQAGTCGDRWAPCPDSSTPSHVNMQLDWVAQYSPK